MPKVFLETCASSGFWARGGAAGAGEAGRWWGEKVTPEALGSGPGSAAEAELRATRCLPRCEESPVCSPGERGRDREVTLRAGVWTVARTFERGTDWHGLKPSLPSAGAFRSRRREPWGPALGSAPALTGRWEGEGGAATPSQRALLQSSRGERCPARPS